jgi:YndJ-like protein
MTLGLIEALFLLAPLAVVRLALRLVRDDDEPAGWRRLHQRVHPIATAAALLSFGLSSGPLAAALASAWLAFTVLLALDGLRRLTRKGLQSANVAVAGGLLYVPIGGGWLVLSRLGAQPMGFLEPIVLLTAVHFHYAAFATPILVGGVARFATARILRSSYPVLVVAALAGPLLVAAGITFSPSLGLFGAGVQSLAVLGVSVVLGGAARRHSRSAITRLLLGVSAISPWLTAPLALAYAWGEVSKQPTISLPDMARIHGVVNALGFVLCALLGLVRARDASPVPAVPVTEGRREESP